MMTGQTFFLPRTGATFAVIETDAKGTRGIAEGLRNRGRVLVVEEAEGYYAREVTDNGGCGSLLETLDPRGPRYAAKPSTL